MDLTKLFELKQKLTSETNRLFVEFLLRALRSRDPDRYVKRALRAALDLPEVEVVDPGEGPRR